MRQKFCGSRKNCRWRRNRKGERTPRWGGVSGLFAYSHNRETTDDAQVDGHITPMASKVYGRVAQVLVEDNQPVKGGQVLVKIDGRDYQAALDQAKASLALA